MSEIKKKKAKGGKKMNRRSFLKTTGMAAGAVAFSGFHFVRTTRAATGPFKVGLPIPLTGPYGTEALDQQAGAELAVAEVNEAGGVLGRKVELIVRDTQLKAAEAVITSYSIHYTKLYESRPTPSRRSCRRSASWRWASAASSRQTFRGS